MLRQVMAAFAMIGKPVLTTGEVLSFAYADLELLGRRPRPWHYKHVRDVCRQMCWRVGRGNGRGRRPSVKRSR